MQGRMFDHIQNLEKSRTNWKIKARLTRFWPTFAPETSTIKGYNLILLDDDNSHVHAYVYPDNWRAIGKEVAEGKVYVVENFQVRDTIGKLKPVSTKLCLRLLNSTTIKEVEDDVMIPKHKFEFMDMGDLLEECDRLSENQNPEFAYDVIGAVEEFDKVKRVPTRYGERDQTRFIFTDGRLREEGYKPGKVYADSTSNASTRIVIEKTSFKQMIEDPGNFRYKRTVMIKFVITKVEEEDNWWFNSCVSCQAEVEKIDKKFKCHECNRSFGYCEKRFRIFVLADDSTLLTNVILLDRVVKRLAGTTVANLLTQIKQDNSVTVASAILVALSEKRSLFCCS
ncbi:uncharacterized protein LOC135147006 isoform X2 [Daucus carota subsp. sativus]|uniref:uncharacterized protein LOC135147006 isoform X2 n=1 Tax=Daucus carota subsp. sativus TaxID=79200 RepID=UPI0030831DC8